LLVVLVAGVAALAVYVLGSLFSVCPIQGETIIKVAGVVLTWPFVALVFGSLLLCVPGSARRLSEAFVGFKLKAWGTEMDFSQEGAKKAVKLTDEVFSDFEKSANAEYKRCVARRDISELLSSALESARQGTAGFQDLPKGFRATIHVPDIVYDETLVQLVDYWPSGGGRGRRKSVRFGMIGLSCRTKSFQSEPKLSQARRELVTKWGMTDTEALDAAARRAACACVVLKDERDVIVGLIYYDATEVTANQQTMVFDNKVGTFGGILENRAKDTGLLDSLKKLKDDLEPYATRFRLHS
jgi:hypothetical protein